MAKKPFRYLLDASDNDVNTECMAGMNEKEKERYRRQLILPGWGEAAQDKLRRAVVFSGGGSSHSTVEEPGSTTMLLGTWRVLRKARSTPGRMKSRQTSSQLILLASL